MRTTLLACAKILTAALLAWALIGLAPARGHYRPNTKHNRVHAVNHAFCAGNVNGCRLGNEALRVAYCESHLWPWANNSGRYLGMFQVSTHWIRTVPGWAWGPWHQARHAYRIYRLTGGWSHWSCRP